MRSTNGALILVLGILSWVLCSCFTGIPAWIMGNQSMKLIDSGQGDPNERTLVQVGRILGMVSVIFTVVVGGLYLLAIAGVIGLGIFAGAAQPPR